MDGTEKKSHLAKSVKNLQTFKYLKIGHVFLNIRRFCYEIQMIAGADPGIHPQLSNLK